MTDSLKNCGCGGEAFIYDIEAHQHHFCDMPDYKGETFVECSKCSMCASSIEDWNKANTRVEAEPAGDVVEPEINEDGLECATDVLQNQYLDFIQDNPATVTRMIIEKYLEYVSSVTSPQADKVVNGDVEKLTMHKDL